jgi:putative methyltransferase (TIGR04325 family)
MAREDFLPPILLRLLLRVLGRSSLTGDYPNWEAALSASAPYKTDLRVYGRLTEEVRIGQKRSSRLLSPLLTAILMAGGQARVLDFGGNLGFVYFDACRLAASNIDWWHVVDLQEIVTYGNQNFSNQKLRFFASIDQAVAVGTPNIVLCFHVLQYLASPFEYISTLMSLSPALFVLHEFPIADRQRFMVQHLLPELGGGSRPVRIFSEREIAEAFVGYDLLEEIVLRPWDRALVGARQVARIYRRRP